MPSPRRSTLFPYTTLFRSPLSRPRNLQWPAGRYRRRGCGVRAAETAPERVDRKSTRLNSSHLGISYAVSTEIDALSLHDALPISSIKAQKPTVASRSIPAKGMRCSCCRNGTRACRSEEHTSELQSLRHLVCRLHGDRRSFPTRRSSDLLYQGPEPYSGQPVDTGEGDAVFVLQKRHQSVSAVADVVSVATMAAVAELELNESGG